MDLSYQQLAIVDLNNKTATVTDAGLALELLKMLVEDLPATQGRIKSAIDDENVQNLTNELHRLFGACCYCPTPRLQALVQLFQQQCRSDYDKSALNTYCQHLNSVVDDTTAAYHDLKNDDE